MNKNNPEKYCIYHNNCADGFTAAWVMKQKYPNIHLQGATYGEQPPLEDVKGKDVYLVDFCYYGEAMLKLIETANSVTILDHHKTAQQEVQTLLDSGKVQGVFDMTRSGAMITWNYCFPNQTPPKLIEYVQDRDLWTWNLDNSQEVSMAVFSYKYTIANWDELMSMDISVLVNEGRAILRKHQKDIEELSKVVKTFMQIGRWYVPVANVPYTMGSDMANLLAMGEPFAGYYYDTPKGRVFGLRSQPDGEDVSLIAKQYGGGGHKHASGFTVKIEDFPELFRNVSE